MEHGGKIVNIGSVMAFEGGRHISAYVSDKHASAGLTKSLATSWAARGINVNCICPVFVEPKELAGLCVFLASDAADFMHGSRVAIDGDWLVR